MVCKNCGEEMNENQAFCAKCGTEMKAEEQQVAGVENQNPAPQMPAQNNMPYFQQPPVILKKKKNSGLVIYICGIVSGVLSVLFGLIMFVQKTGLYEYSSTYGGDAYTGIQNAAAQTANNLIYLSSLTKIGFGFLLIAIGLISIFWFLSKLIKEK